MPYRLEEFVQVAKVISSRQPISGEARHRTVVGRAYYGAYWATCNAVCKTHGINPPTSLDHRALSQAIRYVKDDPPVSELGTYLDTLRELRTSADYYAQRTITEDQADDAVQDAEKVLALLRSVGDRLPFP